MALSYIAAHNYMNNWSPSQVAPQTIVPPAITVTPSKSAAAGPGFQWNWKKGTFEGVTYRYSFMPPSQEGKAIFLLLHGFPNGPSNWRHIIPEFTSKGYGVIIPELLGYGETDAPNDVESYAYHFICRHIALILDAEGIDKVVGLGHDFGAPFCARFSQFYPDRVTAIILGGPPYTPPSSKPLNIDAALSVFKPVLGYENIGYFKFFATEDAPTELDDHLESFLSVMFGPPSQWKERLCKIGGLKESLDSDYTGPIESWFGEKGKDELVEYFKKHGGLRGPCMWFRAGVSNVNATDAEDIDPRIHHPYLYISPKQDPTYPLKIAEPQDALCDDITTKTINTGHWIFEQDPKGSASLVLEWGQEKGLF